MNTKRLWDCMRNITNMNPNRKQIVTMDDLTRANELNDFFLRFDIESSAKGLEGFNFEFIPSCNASNRIRIDPQQVQCIFSKVCNKKSA